MFEMICIWKHLNLWLKLLYLISGTVVLSSLALLLLQTWLLRGMILSSLDFSLRCQDGNYTTSDIGYGISWSICFGLINAGLSVLTYSCFDLSITCSKSKNNFTLSAILAWIDIFFLAAFPFTFMAMTITLSILVHDNPCSPINQ